MKNQNLFLKPKESYALLDSGGGKKLERFGKYTLIRRESQALWNEKNPILWEAADAEYARTNDKYGEWKKLKDIPNEWVFEPNVGFKLKLKLTPFGHVGVFPELEPQWNWITNNCKRRTNPKVLSLFSYTGAASLAAINGGALVTHVDASKPAISWAVENQKLSGLDNKPIRWIVDDALKFVKREERRGNKYDGIIMDPPKFGRGPKGEVWQFEDNVLELIEACKKILSENPLFFLIIAYSVPVSSITLANMLSEILPEENIEHGEIVIEEESSKRLLPTSIFARWSSTLTLPENVSL